MSEARLLREGQFIQVDSGQKEQIKIMADLMKSKHIFDMTNATVSYHLSQLKKAGLIFESREKNYIYYSLNASVLEEVLLWIQSLKGVEEHEK